jgi:hypothetical protein
MKSYNKVEPITVWGSLIFFFYYPEDMPYDIMRGRSVVMPDDFRSLFHGDEGNISVFATKQLKEELG